MLKKINKYLIFTLTILLLLTLGGCSLGHPDYTLEIKIADGISGTPASGIYSVEELETFEYDYKYEDGREELPEIYLNNIRLSKGTGSFVMYADALLEVGQKDIRGIWTITMYDQDYDTLDVWDATFEGTDPALLSGTFHDTNGRTGTWTILNDYLEVNFDNWEGYTLKGKASSMNGSWTGGGTNGTWYAEQK